MGEEHPARLGRERMGLQATIAACSLVPITAGAAGLLLGPRFVGGPADLPDLASHFAYLSGLLLGLGLGFLATVPGIERRGLLSARARLSSSWVALPVSWPLPGQVHRPWPIAWPW